METNEMDTPKYAGFWIRFAAMVIDNIWLGFVIYGPILIVAFTEALDADSTEYRLFYTFFEFVLPFLLVMWMWAKFQATPANALLKIKVVDAKTFERASLLQYFLRYLGYFVSILTLFIGFFWAGWDKKKQCFHDMIGGTVVIYESNVIS